MCGIVGILGKHEVAPILVDALKRLEYRGYDSAGIATVHEGALDRRRATGKLMQLSDALVRNPIRGLAGIGHTRWATHGGPTEVNAHPHMAGKVAVVHNGIIENYAELRADLTAKGQVFETETDSETVAQLCAYHLAAGLSPQAAVEATLKRLEGAFALCFLFDGEGDLMIAARKGSPLAIGYGEDEMFVGSDALALAPMTNRMAYLEEGDYAVLTRQGAQVFAEDGSPVTREIRQMDLDTARVEKGAHKHFMAKEIHEQPMVAARALGHYVNTSTGSLNFAEGAPDFANADRIILVACGTAFYACQVAKYWFEQLAGIPVEIDVASEFRYREPPLRGREIAIFVSQSGETADTLAALRYCAGKVQQVVAVVNVETSSIARESDLVLPIMAGVEVGVASTKAFTCQLVVLAALALEAANQTGLKPAAERTALLNALADLPRHLSAALSDIDSYPALCLELSKAQDILFLGRGPLFPLAMEGALKLKEITYIHAEGYASGELKHGPIALIDESVPVIVFAPKDALFDKTVSNMQEVMARGGKVVLVTDKDGAATASEGAWRVVTLPSVPPILAPILYALPAQLFAYYTAVAKGTDVDQPRNLAKSVTVE